MNELTRKTAEELVPEDDLLWRSSLWRSLFTSWGVFFAADTDSIILRGFKAELTMSCDEHLRTRMVCVCSYPANPDVNDIFTVTYKGSPVSVKWLRWGNSSYHLLTRALFTWPFSNFGGDIIERVNKTMGQLLGEEV